MKLLVQSACIAVTMIAATASHAQPNELPVTSPNKSQQNYRWVAASAGDIPHGVVPFGGINTSNTPGEVTSVETFVARAIDSSSGRKWLAACDGNVARTFKTNHRSRIASLVEYRKFEALVPEEGYSLVWVPAGRKLTDQSLAQLNALKLDVGIPDRSPGCSGYLIRFNDGAGNVVPAFYGTIAGTQVPSRTSPMDMRQGGIGTLEVLTVRKVGEVVEAPMQRAGTTTIVDLAMGLPGDGPKSFRLRTPTDGRLISVGIAGDETSVSLEKQMRVGVNPDGRQVWLLNKAIEGKFHLRETSVGRYLNIQESTGAARDTLLGAGDAGAVFEIEVIDEAAAKKMISRRAIAHYENSPPHSIGFVRFKEAASGKHIAIEKDPKLILSARDFDIAQLFMLELLDAN